MLIDYKNVNIYHKDGETVLSNVNFHVGDGEFVYVIGRVGTGKSSLLKSIYFEMDIDEAEEATESENEDEENTQQTPAKQMIPLPLDMADVILTLWSVDDLKTNK